MFLLQFPQCRNMLPCIFLGTPNGAKKHDRLVIVLQVAALVAVNIDDFRHVSSPEMVVFSSLLLLSVICHYMGRSSIYLTLPLPLFILQAHPKIWNNRKNSCGFHSL